jgi:predicted O-methyltransferase YrrM
VEEHEAGIMSQDLTWSNDHQFTLDDTSFHIDLFAAVESNPDRFTLAKTPWMIEEYLDLLPEYAGGRLVELGIAQGGSVALFAQLAQPKQLLAVDIETEPVAALAEFIEAHGYADTVHTAYGVDQADRPGLEALVSQYFGDDPLDLVVDDASHLLAPSQTSFTTLFPRLRPGGVFVIEDWSHGHHWERALRDEYSTEELAVDGTKMPDLSQLVLELALAVGFAPEVVSDIRIRHGFAVVRRGEATLDPATFDLSQCHGDLARLLLRER